MLEFTNVKILDNKIDQDLNPKANSKKQPPENKTLSKIDLHKTQKFKATRKDRDALFIKKIKA